MVPEIFETQTKKVTDGAKTRTLLACGNNNSVVRLDGRTAHLQTRKPRIIIIVNGERNQKTAMHHDDTLLPGASGTSTRNRSIHTTRSLVQ